jgi:hypothetical protein
MGDQEPCSGGLARFLHDCACLENTPIPLHHLLTPFAMKRSATLFFLFFFLLGSKAFAQSEATEQATKVAKEYAVTLEFSAEQIEQAKKVFAEHLRASRENWQNTDGERDAFNEKQQATFKATDAKIKAMLNDAQLEKYVTHREELKRKALDRYVSEFIEP